MPEGPNKFLVPAEKQRSFFAEQGALTSEERMLSRFLSGYVERQRISLASFGAGDLASVEKISADRAEIKAQKAKIQRDNEHIAKLDPEHFFAIERGALSEQAIIYGMQAGEWIGEGSKVRVASEYDDFFNGIDCIVEFDSTKHLAIGIDTTISKEKIVQKLRRIRDKILDGELAEVRYFKNENFTGSLHNVPLTVVGANLETNSSLAQLVYDTEMTDQFHSGDKPDKKDKAQKKIRTHKIQFIILFEIRMQLETFLQFAIKNGKDKLTLKLKDDLAKIKEVIADKAPKNKAEREKLISEIKNDEVFKMIKQTLKTEFTEWEESGILVAKLK